MVMWRFSYTAVPSFVLFLSVCGCAEPEDRVGTERVRVGDTVFVHSHFPEYPDTVRMREVLRIGMLDGPEEYMFGDIFSFGVGPEGDLFVHDRGEGIRHYGPGGTFLGWIARQGEGPKEVEYVPAINVSPGGLVAAHDYENRHIILFHSGDSVTHVPGPEGRPAYSDTDALLFHKDGTLWVKINTYWPPPGGLTHPRPIFARVQSSDRTLVDTIFSPANAAEGCPTLSELAFTAGVWEDKRERWIPKTLWASGPDGTSVLGCPATYQFSVTKPNGETFKISRDWTPVPEAEEALKYMASWTNIGDLPPTLPAYAQIILPGDGRIWVWPSRPSRSEKARQELVEMYGVTERWVTPITGTFDVFGPDGHWMAVVQPPSEVQYNGLPTTTAVVIRGDTLWAVAKDSLDVSYLVRCEVVWPSRRKR